MKKPSSIQVVNIRSRARAMGVLDGALWLAALSLVVTSAIWTKTTGALPALVGIERPAQVEEAETPIVQIPESVVVQTPIVEVVESQQVQVEEQVEAEVVEAEVIDPSYRFFDGKLVRPARVMYMTVTGYSPDARSCGEFADGKTAIMKSVWTNGMKLVAADPTVLPYWSMVSVPGYAGSEIVPVLDCGGAIKGSRLDLLYPTHKMARKWGVRQVPVTVWEYVDEQ
jgi:3D (Asp-Asp-Asp) domain-containing protein